MGPFEVPPTNEEDRPSPLSIVEAWALEHGWPFERFDDEIEIVVAGAKTTYHVSFTWMSEIEVLHIACAFDFKVPDQRRDEMHKLLALINEQQWIGHFDLWDDGVAMFRYGLLLAGGTNVSSHQCEVMLGMALDTSECYYPAFHFVVWAGKSAKEAFEFTSFETKGNA